MSGWSWNWELTFVNGTTLNRVQNNRYEKSNRVDPNNPGTEVIRVSLIPHSDKLKKVTVDVPKGTLPVVARETIAPSWRSPTVIYKIGYNIDGVRIMKCIEPKENKIFSINDEGGRKG